ncbi:DNA-directed RNA polymerase III subunit RPC3 [Plutella xylostella]|uniref:DNA-directed RNA polymerase III subunit RPC3 n=1 Tax=Plutella xylostella TaxID=51655 RepID=UPI00203253B1|nr:DNA-directed RNA polymerase III subunit RPC3 [Plutella xylostella]
MSHQLGSLVSEILNRHFGEIVQKVGDDLFSFGARPVAAIAKTTEIPRIKVVESLRTLLKYDLVTFEPSKNEVVADYKIVPDNILLLMRYPRYLLQIKSKHGSKAEMIVEEVLQRGCVTATNLLVTLARKYKDDREKNISIVSLKDMFISLATAGYLQQAAVAEVKEGEGGEVPTMVAVATIVPELDARTLVLAMNEGAEVTDNIYWKVNFDRFHQDFRDEIMIDAMTRRVDENAGELMRHLLVQVYLNTPPWAASSTPVPALQLKESTRRGAAERPLLAQFVDHYLRVVEENGCGFVRRSGDASGGQFVVQMQRAAKETVYALLEHTVNERLGSNAARIFRLIRDKKYIEEEDIRKHAMVPNKECKELTYKLMEHHFISVQPMRKAASGGGLVKAIYLYYINLHETAHTARELCYRACHNGLRRAAAARRAHARLLDKQRRVRSVVHSMRVREDPQQHIARVEETITPPERQLIQSVEKQLKQLSTAEIELDKALFILHWYFMYKDN